MIMSIVAALALFTGCKGDEPLDNPGNAELTLTQTLVLMFRLNVTLTSREFKKV